MTQSRRLGQLNAAENWVNTYRYLTNANFKAYDFESLRAALLNYVQTNYPEDFNDFINSSEYVALIDLMAYMGQNIAFRSDLNLRETFLETAEVRGNVLSIARQLGYKPYRNIAAGGFLKIASVSTTQNILDSKGTNLAGQTIVWGDPLNADFNEQFTLIMNQALNKSNPFGRPISRIVDNGVTRQLYQIDQLESRTMVETVSLPSKNNNTYICELVPANIDIESQLAVESVPNPYGYLSLLFNNDGSGFAAQSNGWFFMFKQGRLKFDDYVLTESVENRVIDINSDSINNTDVWVQSIDDTGRILENWTQVSNITGNNIVFNNVNKDTRKLFEVITRENDAVSIKFGDGVFSDIPTGNIRVWYRQSASEAVSFVPINVINTEIYIDYIDSLGITQTLTVALMLNDVVSNSPGETIGEIKNRASRTAATQERMITGSDYNTYPEGKIGGIAKVKSINRIHAGQSLFSDFQDPTGTYRPAISLADDGFIYNRDIVEQTTIDIGLSSDEVVNVIENELLDRSLHQFYYKKYQPIVSSDTVYWKTVDTGNSISHGYFVLDDGLGLPLRIGKGNPDIQFRNLRKNTLIKTVDGVWTKISDVYREGFGLTDNLGVNTGLRANGQGAVFLNSIINNPDPVRILAWLPALRTVFAAAERIDIAKEIDARRDFAIRYDQTFDRWRIVRADNIDLSGDFSLANAGNNTNQNLDSSWLVRFTYNTLTESWSSYLRKDQTTFGSKSQLVFYNTKFGKGLDRRTRRSVSDTIKILTINNNIQEELTLDIVDYYKLNDSRNDFKRVLVWAPGLAETLVPNNPELISKIINNQSLTLNRVELVDAPGQYTLLPADGTTGEIGPYPGRQGLKIQYNHVPLRDMRINPTTTNIIDMYVLTAQFNAEFRGWIAGGSRRGLRPIPPDSYTLSKQMSSVVPAKSISDSIVFHPVNFKVIFGVGSDLRNQVKIRVTKSDGTKISDAEIRSRVIQSINDYFSVDNWEFGETFYFTDMASWVHTRLGGIISSIALIPRQTGLTPNDMFQIRCDDDEIFISSASVSDVEIITSAVAVTI